MDDIKPKKPGQGPPAPRFFVPGRETPPQPEPNEELADDSELFDLWEPAEPVQHHQPPRRDSVSLRSPSVSVRPRVAVDFNRKQSKTERPPQESRGRRKLILILIIILLLVIGAGALYWFKIRSDKKPVPVASQQTDNTEEKPEKLTGNFRVIATGDFIAHDSINQNAKTAGGYDYAPMLAELKPVFAKASARICHDTVPASGGALSGYPSFNAPTEFIDGMADLGCNVMSLTSDHINDKGQPAIDATLNAIDKHKDKILLTQGANRTLEEQNKDATFNTGNGALTFAYLSYTTRQASSASTPFSVNGYSKEIAQKQIADRRSKVDFVIVSMCWGKEDSADVQAEQDAIAQELADAGADIVLGHCTHEVQPVKKLKASTGSRETIVWYSLGNALNSQLPIETLIGGLAVIDIDLATKKITNIGIMPTYMHYEWTAQQKQAKDLNSRKNLKLYPLDKAEAPLAASQNGTTVQAQTDRIKEIVNRFTPVPILTSTQLQTVQ